MAEKRVLDIGECDYDHSHIKSLLKQFGVLVARAHTFSEARELVAKDQFDLILVNRITEVDGTRGLDFIKELKGTPAFKGLRVMLVSNYPDAQADAIAEGAEAGFGKDALDSPETKKILERILK